MSQSRYILAHDLGTTGNKATLFDAASGTAVTTAFEAYETAYPRPNWVEQDPADWWRAVRDSTRELLTTSGGARSALWRQILADVYGLPILRPALLAEATSLGAAMAGGVGVGLFPDFGVAHELVKVEEGERPDPAHNQRYTALYSLFQQTYTALEPIFEQLATLAK